MVKKAPRPTVPMFEMPSSLPLETPISDNLAELQATQTQKDMIALTEARAVYPYRLIVRWLTPGIENKIKMICRKHGANYDYVLDQLKKSRAI